MRTIIITNERPVTYSSAEIPKEVPVELSVYFPGGSASTSATVVEFDGNTYHLLDGYKNVLIREAIEMNTGEIVRLDFLECCK